MKIDNYSVAMNSQYYNLTQDYTDVEVSHEVENFNSKESLDIQKVELSLENSFSDDSDLSVALSKAILKSISDDENRSIRDRVELTQVYTEDQALNFEVKAYVQTDSREIELSLDISLKKFYSKDKYHLREP